jgi:hypothetical protein
MGPGRPCTICTRSDVAEIDAALVSGPALPAISRHFALSRHALARHRDQHMPLAARQSAAESQSKAEATRGATLLESASELRIKALIILHKAETAGDLRTALMGVREAARCIELMAKLTGEIDGRATVNILINPAFVQVRAAIILALAGYPEARAAVSSAMEAIQ